MKKIVAPKTIPSKQKQSSSSGKQSPRPELAQQFQDIDELDVRISLIQALIPLGLKAVQDTLEAEVTHLAGKRYSRSGGHPNLDRWGIKACYTINTRHA